MGRLVSETRVPGTSAKLQIQLLKIHKFIAAILRKRAIWGEFPWIAIGQTASVLGAIVGVKLLTGALPPNVYGELALAMTAATLVNQIILGPLGNAYSRFYAPAEEAGELGSYLGLLLISPSSEFHSRHCEALSVQD